MEQFSIFETEGKEQLVFEAVREQAKSAIAEEGAPLEWLALRKNKDCYAIVFRESVVARLHDGKKPYYARCSNDLKKEYTESINDTEIVRQIVEDVKRTVTNAPTDFSCCSRYAECSDAGCCTHPDKEFSFGCYYRKNLKKGRVFYGKRREDNLLHGTCAAE